MSQKSIKEGVKQYSEMLRSEGKTMSQKRFCETNGLKYPAFRKAYSRFKKSEAGRDIIETLNPQMQKKRFTKNAPKNFKKWDWGKLKQEFFDSHLSLTAFLKKHGVSRGNKSICGWAAEKKIVIENTKKQAQCRAVDLFTQRMSTDLEKRYLEFNETAAKITNRIIEELVKYYDIIDVQKTKDGDVTIIPTLNDLRGSAEVFALVARGISDVQKNIDKMTAFQARAKNKDVLKKMLADVRDKKMTIQEAGYFMGVEGIVPLAGVVDIELKKDIDDGGGETPMSPEELDAIYEKATQEMLTEEQPFMLQRQKELEELKQDSEISGSFDIVVEDETVPR